MKSAFAGLFLALMLDSRASAAPDCGTAGMCQCATEWRCLPPGGTCAQACGLSGGSAPASGGYNPQQQMILNGAQMMMPALQQGIHNAIYGDPAQKAGEEARRRAADAQRKRLLEEQAHQDEESKNRLLGGMQGVERPAPAVGGSLQLLGTGSEDASSLRLLSDGEAAPKNPPTRDPRFKSRAFSTGYEAASRCITQNAGAACSDAAPDRQELCLNDYRAGYDVGRKAEDEVLDRAVKKGAAAATKGQENNGAADSESGGDCRTQWVEAYNRGYYAGAHAPRAKK